ncbi:MAG: hypothetical protein GC191_20670 [Azospirillum sp.]|nr:hypothetical protein [Azospirillum sp.]
MVNCSGLPNRASASSSADTQNVPVLVGFDDDSAFVPEAAWLARSFPDHRVGFRSNSWITQAAAARAGFGIALLPCYLGQADAGLIPIGLGREPPTARLSLLVRADLTTVPRVHAVTHYLSALFRSCRPLFERPVPGAGPPAE